MARLEDVEGIGRAYARKLRAAGVRSTSALLERGATPKDRRVLAARTGLGRARILEWVNRVDLFRIKGVAEEYSDLLEAAGVDTVVELARRKPAVLHRALAATNLKKKLVRRLPAARQVAAWVRQAKRLPRKVRY